MKLNNNLLKIATLSVVTLFFTNCSKEKKTIELTKEAEVESSAAFGLEDIPGKYIVVLKTDRSLHGRKEDIRGKALGLLKRNGAMDAVPEFVYDVALQGFSVSLNRVQMERMLSDEAVEYIEQDQLITLNQDFQDKKRGGRPGNGGGGDVQPTQETPWGITSVGGKQNGSGKKAWIIDSGIDLDHPDLKVDVASSKSFLSGKQGSNPDDQHGHGTHVAGTVAAIDNNIGVIGVAAGATVVSVRVLDRRGSGSTSGVIAGVNYVAANASAGEVANMSLGGGVSTTLDNAVIAASSTTAQVKFALAAGNESDWISNHSPARATGTNIYTVTAHDVNNNWASFSNRTTSTTNIYCAPGVAVKSTWKGKGYNTINGTSMACPHVCGLLLMGSITGNGSVSGDPAAPADALAHK